MDVLDEDENQAIQRLKFLSLMSRFIWNNICAPGSVGREWDVGVKDFRNALVLYNDKIKDLS